MQTPTQSKSRSLLGVSDLTLVAPIKPGLIQALDARSYETRLALLLRTLATLRMSSLEADPTPLLGDAVDRIRAIHSFRLAVVDKQLLLSVAFDGGWEPYMRRIWRDLGPLLDVIFCNCDGYLLAHEHSFAQYAAWVRSAQLDTQFFYNAGGVSVSDLEYLRESARRSIDGPAQQTQPQPAAQETPEEAQEKAKKKADEILRQALPALTALYRLSDMYPQGTPDGECLQRAARSLLRDLAKLEPQPKPSAPRATEKAALSWFAAAKKDDKPELPDKKDWKPDAQGGILTRYPDITHACLLLIELKDAQAAQALLGYMRSRVKDSAADRQDPGPFFNLGFTAHGLQVAGLEEGSYGQLPQEFREGMAARAGILGDWEYNHPTNWTLPRRNWPDKGSPERVELSCVHAAVQIALRAEPSATWQELVDGHPLYKDIAALEAELRGRNVRILSVQPMQRLVAKAKDEARDRFGFVDGLSQPTLTAASGNGYSDQVRPGDLLLGHPNGLQDPALTGRLWDDSTFLVIRKLRQHVDRLETVLATAPKLPTDEAKALLMGRRLDGRSPLVDEKSANATKTNTFDYKKDAQNTLCPLHSHVRRANPRETRDDLQNVPRIMRRGMSYGPAYDKNDQKSKEAERGLVFMAYNASIAEQFELIQSWLAGGNSTGPHSYSALCDPFLGVRRSGGPRTFVVGDHRIDLGAAAPLVELEWGLYVFVPSISALGELEAIASETAELEKDDAEARRKGVEPVPGGPRSKKEDRRERQRTAEAMKGAAIIKLLQQAEQVYGFEAARDRWKIALEDVGARMSGVSRCIWTAVRLLHEGVLRTPYGVLVCSHKRVIEVFANGEKRYTVSGYQARMQQAFGPIYLGMDDDGEKGAYRTQSEKPNAAIMEITRKDGFQKALACTEACLVEVFKKPTTRPDATVEVEVKDLINDVLAAISKAFFGLPDGTDDTVNTHVKAGGWYGPEDDAKPTCPGHFHSPSRYMFQPNPGREAIEKGQAHGETLFEAVRAFVQAKRNALPKARLAEAFFAAIPRDGASEAENNAKDALLARTLIGAMMGFLPTVDGNLRSALYEWVNDQSLWDYQIDYLEHRESSLKAAEAAFLRPLQRTLQLRPVPELTWRTAQEEGTLGPVKLRPGDVVVLSIVSATQEKLLADEDDLEPLFGGWRTQDPQKAPKPPPTHACPGYEMAMGVMLGVLAGLVGSARLRPTLTPMALRMSARAGWTPAKTSAAAAPPVPSASASAYARTPT